MKILVVLMLTALLSLFLLPGKASAQGVVDLSGFGSVYYSSHIINPPNAERYSSLILNMWDYVHEACVTNLSADDMAWCYPPLPIEINIHILPYKEFMILWREGPGVEDDCDERQSGCVVYGYTAYVVGAGVFDIYYYEEPMDLFLIHEITHVIEFSRGEAVDEERTEGRGIMYFMSSHYVEWLGIIG